MARSVQLLVGEPHVPWAIARIDSELPGPAILPDPVATLLEQVVQSLILSDPPALGLVLIDQDEVRHGHLCRGGGLLGGRHVVS